MDINQDTSCIFCRGLTKEQTVTRIGVVYIHPECLADLEEMLFVAVEEMEEIS